MNKDTHARSAIAAALLERGRKPPVLGPLSALGAHLLEERRLASGYVSLIDRRLEELQTSGHGMAREKFEVHLKILKSLVDFALKHKISLSDPEWPRQAIWGAAMEHLQPTPPRREGASQKKSLMASSTPVLDKSRPSEGPWQGYSQQLGWRWNVLLAERPQRAEARKPCRT